MPTWSIFLTCSNMLKRSFNDDSYYDYYYLTWFEVLLKDILDMWDVFGHIGLDLRKIASKGWRTVANNRYVIWREQ